MTLLPTHNWNARIKKRAFLFMLMVISRTKRDQERALLISAPMLRFLLRYRCEMAKQSGFGTNIRIMDVQFSNYQ